MYKNFTGQEYKKFIGLPDDYKIDGMLIYGTWQKQKQFLILEQALKDLGIEAKLNASLPNFLDRMVEITVGDKKYWFDVSYGGALLSEYLHLACLFGSQKNILLGTCGGLLSEVNSCDFVIPTYSYGNESTTRMYAPQETDHKHIPNLELNKNLREKIDKKYKVLEGPTITCQAMMGETFEDVQKWSKDGYYGVEMEAATVFAVSSHFHVTSSAILIVGDNLIKEETVLSESYENNRNLKEEVRKEQYKVALTELFQ
jgi:purine-nucleoside phosphorylase